MKSVHGRSAGMNDSEDTQRMFISLLNDLAGKWTMKAESMLFVNVLF